MGRRKQVLDDGDSDSIGESDNEEMDIGNDPDAREERELFENPYSRKRKRKGKESHIYGVFGDDSEEDESERKGKKRSDWAKAPAFVAGEKKVDLDQEMEDGLEDDDASSNSDDGENDGLGGEDALEEDSSDDSAPSRAPSPRIRVEEEEPPERPRMGLGAKSSGSAFPSFSGAGIGSKAGLGSKPGLGSKLGIGAARTGLCFTASTTGDESSSRPPASRPPEASTSMEDGSSRPTPEATPPVADVPTAFGRASKSFVRDSTAPKKAPQLTPAERAHFSGLQSTFGARMLEKMGWTIGTGLGAEGEGIVAPVESKLRPQRAGIAYKGFKEKTEQSKAEARRKGLEVSDDEEDIKVKKFKKKVKQQEEKRSDVWKRPKRVKVKIEHKTYEQIIAEAGTEQPPTGLGQIIDATGAVPREVSSLADVSLNSWAPSSDPTRIPEVRHNIRLIAEVCKTDLDGLAREAKSLQERKKYATNEDLRLRRQVENEVELIARLQQVQIVANDINTKAKELASVEEVSLEALSPFFTKLIYEYAPEFDQYALDEIVVAAIAPLVRRMVNTWNPLEDPSFFVTTFRTWRKALKVNTLEDKPIQSDVSIYGSALEAQVESQKTMTPFESLLWNVWLPKVRTSLNNNWSPDDPTSAIRLYEAWSTFLPPFIRDNIMDQLILPKVHKAVLDWNPKQGTSLQNIIFPWLPHAGLRLEELLGDARRKFKSLLRSWSVEDEMPSHLAAWRDVFDVGDWDSMLLKYVVPKLGATLRNDFRINPRDQKMEPFQAVLQWWPLIRPSIFSQIVESEFFPKWLDVLHIWLIQPRVSFEEVRKWYTSWKDAFPEDLQNLQGVTRGFTRGLQLMNKAIELGPKAPKELPRPDYRAEIAELNAAPSTTKKETPRPSTRTQEITFRSLVEEFAASHNLLVLPIGRAHERSRMPLFRVSSTVDGRGGLLVYILDDAVWAAKTGVGSEAEDFYALTLDEMVRRAQP
ncbi:TFP11-domain-containing protein [Pluteus cervinus]|uniref:TFP11-domain-containing protein n=1 Tax=Pluteus cervinus TaxID=181527 RepID=A0ACD3BAX8_9AGAR|nr:TFP11-domain-containing protein [Pluteus cervinus]